MNYIFKLILLSTIVCFIPIVLKGQTVDLGTYSFSISPTEEGIKIDGLLTEAAWERDAVADNFIKSKPTDGGAAESETMVWMTYDSKNLYIAAMCFDDLEGDYVVQSLKRDFSFPVNDAFAVFLDPFNNQNAGFSFAVSPLGVQREGLVQSGGQFGVTTSWDQKWFCKTAQNEGFWTVEMAIPLNSIQFDTKQSTWRINFARNDLKRFETSTWVPVPNQINVASLAFCGEMNWNEKPKGSGKNITLVPYVKFGASRDKSNGEKASVDIPEVGMDAKIALSSAMNLELTINPDFSQVEVDRQVTNLDRFSIFFPERRRFFLDNSDLFSYGIGPMRPFFSRRIGLSGGSPIPILLGLRLTGNVAENTRIGVLSVQTEGVPGGVKSQNFSVLTAQQKLWKRSYISASFINRQAFNGFSMEKDDYNRTLGTEMVYRSNDNKFEATGMVYQTFSASDDPDFDQGTLGDRLSAVAIANYENKALEAFASLEYVGEDFKTDVGFTQELFQRNDELGTINPIEYIASLHFFAYRIYPEKWEKMRLMSFLVRQKLFMNSSTFTPTDRETLAGVYTEFKNSSYVDFSVINYDSRLYFPTNITGSMETLLEPDNYHFTAAELSYQSTKRNAFYGSATALYGGFYNGKRLGLSSELVYRVQPWGNFALTADYNRIDFPEGYGDASLFLLGPRVELTFNKNVFFTTFFQYNTQAENLNVNSRLQWRFAPMSDLFLVFTDNLNSTDFNQKNWGLVLKLNYWLGL